MSRHARRVLIALVLSWTTAACLAGPWMAADWGDAEPQFPPGSLNNRANAFPTCPVVYRLVLDAGDQPAAWAALSARAGGHAFVYLNGRRVYAHGSLDEQGQAFSAELTPYLKPGKNALVVSAPAAGFSLDGGIGYANGTVRRFGSGEAGWRVQKFAPLTMLELEPFLLADYDDSAWFAVKAVKAGASVEVEPADLAKLAADLRAERLTKLDADAAWRLELIRTKGYVLVDDEVYGWGGPERLPQWVRDAAVVPVGGDATAGTAHARAEALSRWVWLNDEAANLANLAAGYAALGAADLAGACREAGEPMAVHLLQARLNLDAGEFDPALAALAEAQAVSEALRQGKLLNGFCRVVDNKFGWFDNTRLLEGEPRHYGLKVSSPGEQRYSPLSPGQLVSVQGRQFTLSGYGSLPILRKYRANNRDQSDFTGPTGLWAVIDGKVAVLRPGEDGVAYDKAVHGKLDENWLLLLTDMTRGGNLPVELVLLAEPEKITFRGGGAKGPDAVQIDFADDGARLFVLSPFKGWSGFLATARGFNRNEYLPAISDQLLAVCRVWSRALLHWPVTFSEAFVYEPENRSLRVADTYDYEQFTDPWGTPPLKLAPLPAMASYGLLTGYPGLEVLSEAKAVGSRGVWGDEVAAEDTDTIVYRIPVSPIKRFGGFTSFCFGGTDIGGPGSKTEIEAVRRTGANSYRPQHNETGERAMRTAQWCADLGMQNMFNTDEKHVSDIVGHFRTLAEKCKDFAPDLIAYDLLNEPETRQPRDYGAIIKKIVQAIREVDTTHLIYVETVPPWAPGARPFPQGAWENLEPVDDDLLVYSFHDYAHRLGRIEGRREAEAQDNVPWPNQHADMRDLLDRWIPAFRYGIQHRAPIHLGEWGAFEQVRTQNVYENPGIHAMTMDFLNVFDAFGWHWHYYSNRGTVRSGADGALRESYVQKAHRRYFDRGTFNAFYPGQ